jgi:hypothetical protein
VKSGLETEENEINIRLKVPEISSQDLLSARLNTERHNEPSDDIADPAQIKLSFRTVRDESDGKVAESSQESDKSMPFKNG